jgi:tetratricopeptide (TPR) repeat protein
MDFGAISLPVLALSALFGYAVFFDINSVIFNKMNVPAALEYQGYKGDVVAARIANEVRDINKKARTVRELKDFELPDDASAINELGEYFEFVTPIRATQQLLGLTQYNFTGDIVKFGSGYRMQLRGAHIQSNRNITAVEDGDDPEDLIHRQSINAARFIDPYVVASYFYETTVDADSKDFSNTLREIENCLRVLPETDIHWAYNLWGLTLLRQGKPDEAMERFKNALTAKPDFILSVYNTGVTQIAKGANDAAIATFKRVLQLDVAAGRKLRTPHAHTQWGVALAAQGKNDEAADQFQKALKQDAKFALAHYEWGKVLLAQGKKAEAKARFFRAYEYAPERKVYRDAYNSAEG